MISLLLERCAHEPSSLAVCARTASYYANIMSIRQKALKKAKGDSSLRRGRSGGWGGCRGLWSSGLLWGRRLPEQHRARGSCVGWGTPAAPRDAAGPPNTPALGHGIPQQGHRRAQLPPGQTPRVRREPGSLRASGWDHWWQCRRPHPPLLRGKKGKSKALLKASPPFNSSLFKEMREPPAPGCFAKL